MLRFSGRTQVLEGVCVYILHTYTLIYNIILCNRKDQLHQTQHDTESTLSKTLTFCTAVEVSVGHVCKGIILQIHIGKDSYIACI